MFVYSSLCLLVNTLFSKVTSKAPFLPTPFSVVMSYLHIYNTVRYISHALCSILGSSNILVDFFFKIHSLWCIVVLVWQIHGVMFLPQFHSDSSITSKISFPAFYSLTPLPASNSWHLVAFLILVKNGKWGTLWDERSYHN